MRQRWTGLFFAHWEIPPAAAAAALPAGLTPDLHDGRAHVGLVGFRMEAVRPRGLPAVPWLGLYPNVQGLALQLGMVLLIVFIFVRNTRSGASPR